MRQAVEQLTAEAGIYYAEIKADNEASRAVFRETGFVDTTVIVHKRVD
jgi:hypothetical protein